MEVITNELILQRVKAMMATDKEWDFHSFCNDAINGKKERLRQKVKNKKRYDKNKEARLQAAQELANVRAMTAGFE